MENIKDFVLEWLDEIPKTSGELQRWTGLSDVEIRTAVRDLRLEGHRVCSGSQGFWIWNGKDDSWNHTKAMIKSRALSLMALYTAMEDQPIPGQEVMDAFIQGA